jgi:hypothetical protein
MKKSWLYPNGVRVVAISVLMLLAASTLTQANNVQVVATVDSFTGGFLGKPWGTQPAAFEDIKHLADIAPDLLVYMADLDVSSMLGPVSSKTSPRLVFARNTGLVKAHIDFDAKEYYVVFNHLRNMLGEPVPIMYEVRAVGTDFTERSEWRVGRDTTVVLASWLSGACVEISKRDSAGPAGRVFADRLVTALVKRAQECERQNRIIEASSIYQELLNSTDAYQFFTTAALESLAKYSRLAEAADYLAEEWDMAFYGLKTIYAASSGHRWIRVDLGPAAQQELQRQRPEDIDLREELAAIGAVLCRIKAVPVSGKYIVTEQVWLDNSNNIIGGRPAWAPQGSGWPAPYIKQACENFLEAWFSYKVGVVQRVTDW